VRDLKLKLGVTLLVAEREYVESPVPLSLREHHQMCRDFIGLLCSLDMRLKCVGVHVTGRTEDGRRKSKVVYLGVVEG
jgi:hypothetical protein